MLFFSSTSSCFCCDLMSIDKYLSKNLFFMSWNSFLSSSTSAKYLLSLACISLFSLLSWAQVRLINGQGQICMTSFIFAGQPEQFMKLQMLSPRFDAILEIFAPRCNPFRCPIDVFICFHEWIQLTATSQTRFSSATSSMVLFKLMKAWFYSFASGVFSYIRNWVNLFLRKSQM